jgi:YtkA-like
MNHSIPLALATASLFACTGPALASGGGPIDLTSDQGKIKIVLSAVPEGPMNAGNDAVQIALTDPKTGKPVDKEQIELVPFMPTMGHGTDVIPQCQEMGHEQGKGQYLCTNVNLYMPGEWQLRFKFVTPVSDSAAPNLEVQ